MEMKFNSDQELLSRWVNLPGQAQVALLSAPVTFPPIPSIALSIFKSALARSNISACVLYPMFPFLNLLPDQALQRFTDLARYQGLCEFLFAHLTECPSPFSPRDFVEDLFSGQPEAERQDFIRLLELGREKAGMIVEATVQRVLRLGVRVLAVSSIYAQQNASLAICRRAKELCPGLVTLMGGNNISGEMGVAFLERYHCVDYLSFGEGDENIADFCRIVLSGASGPMPYGIVGKDDPMPDPVPHRMTMDMNSVAPPDYTEYYEEIQREREGFYPSDHAFFTRNDPFFGKTVFLEGSRGCWWGQKHACSFCGLNGLVNVYREKKPENLLREIRQAYKAHPDSLIQLSDNILGPAMFRELLPALAADGVKYQLGTEIKTNLKEPQVAALGRAGFQYVQPGIESLNDHLLQLMGKGNDAIHHVALLRYCRTHYVYPFWHLLYAIPGEEERDYRELIDLLPLLTHLTPPTSASPIIFQRYSRYAGDPAAYGLELTPDRSYRYCFGGDEAWRRRIAMSYDLTGGPFKAVRERHQPLYEELSRAVEAWRQLRQKGASPDLIQAETASGISILDTRPCGLQLLTRLTGAAAAVYRLAAAPVFPDTVCRKLSPEYSGEEVERAMRDLTERKLLLAMSGKVLALAIPSVGG